SRSRLPRTREAARPSTDYSFGDVSGLNIQAIQSAGLRPLALQLRPAISFRREASAFNCANLFGSVTIFTWGESSFEIKGTRCHSRARQGRFRVIPWPGWCSVL